MPLDFSAIIKLAVAAGNAVMEVYKQDIEVSDKGDQSPLTLADIASHHCIVDGLKELTPDIPVLSEESTDEEKDQRAGWQRYWLIDPLDGTKEFIKRNGEFTVNIALVDQGRAVFGVVHAPALGVTYWGEQDKGAYKQCEGQAAHGIRVSLPPVGRSGWRIVGSRSHQSSDFQQFMTHFSDPDIVPMGSSLKLCMVAEGAADLYPRLGLTSEWDTAAAQAVVEAAGGRVLEFPSLDPLIYNSRAETLLNPHFIVCATSNPVWSGMPAETPPQAGSPYERKVHSSKADVVWHHASVTKAMRAQQKAQKPLCIWFTGLSGSGKSTLANALDKALHLEGFHTCLLDGDNVRQGLCKDLDMSDVGRSENIRRVAEVAKLMTEAGLIVITAFISPFRHDRDSARALFAEGEFVEVFVDTPLETCKERDPKGLYAKAQRGEIKSFTGVSSLYERPLAAEYSIETVSNSVESIVESIVRGLVK